MSGAPLLRPLTLQYLVTDRLDGVTPAPLFEVPPSPEATLNDDKMVEQTVERLGLLNLTGGGPAGQSSDRLIKWILIYGPRLPFDTDNIGVAFDGVLQDAPITIPAGANGLYTQCLFLPQTAQLRLDGMAGSPSEPLVVRVAIWRPQTVQDWAAMLEACCCINACVDELGESCFTRAIYSDEECESRSITTVQAMGGGALVLARGASGVAEVTGTGFEATDVWKLFQGSSQLLIDSVTFNNPTSVDLAVSVPDDAPVGNYTASVGPPLAGPECIATFPIAVQVTL